ncbi:unnamed protein product [Effrenium voratum]|nr:unnamed protein product [Effrenium voratum]|mmetsp:Transcript_51127/g.122432  ORF Transcript_51127/g.122432 Transcript_51127/m.122432 type:complete len:322 (+) Transcript_51127:60-1025(+)
MAMEHSEVQLQEVGELQSNWPRLLVDDEVQMILAVPGNDSCADCVHANGPKPAWASVTFGIVLCSHAAGRHRSLGTHISRVLSLTLDKWDCADYELMLRTGNKIVNEELEHTLPEGYTKPCEDTEKYAEFVKGLDTFVRSKYQEKAFIQGGSGKLLETGPTRSQATVASVQFSGVLMVKVKSARELICLDVTSESDPYVVAELIGGRQQMRTKSIKNCADPVWDETLMLNVFNPRRDVLRLRVWDADTFTEDDHIGQCDIPLCQIVKRGSGSQPPPATNTAFDDLILTGGDEHNCLCVRLFQRNKPRGFLSVELTYQPLME